MPFAPNAQRVRCFGPRTSLASLLTFLLVAGCQRLGGHPTHTGPGGAAKVASAKKVEGPLPEGVTPRLYDLELTLDPNETTFEARATIAIDVLEPHRHILMHASGLDFKRAVAQSSDGRMHEVTIDALEGGETLRLAIDPPLPSGMASLVFVYEGKFHSDLLGLYRSEAEGRAYIYSQLEFMAARRVFPSFDEPRFKTPFQIALRIPEELVAISNGNVLAEQKHTGDHAELALRQGFKRLVFEPTPPLPTYLLAFAVGPFDQITSSLPAGPERPYALPLRAFSRAGEASKLEEPLGHVPPLLLALEAHNNLPYPFGKLDFLAVPDFAFTGMENAGAITLKDWLMLWDPKRPSYEQRRLFEMVAAHELSHQWFGDWVTMAWWDDLWLNEAFATWQGQKVAHQARPHMQIAVDQVEGIAGAMRMDALGTARRVRQPCVTRDDVYSAADAITYQKGAGILTMFEQYIGSEAMQAGVQAYLRQFPFRTADAANFLAALAKSARAPSLPEAMNSFLQQPGLPDVGMRWTCHDNGTSTLTLSQSRYVPQGSQISGDAQWQVPICLRYGTARGEESICHLLHGTEQSISLRGCPTYLIPNTQGAGYYRWHVPKQGWATTLAALTQRAASAAEAFVWVDNVAAAGQAGHLPAERWTALVAEGLKSPHPRVVRRSLKLLVEAYAAYVNADEQASVEKPLRRMVTPVLEQARRRVFALEKRLGDMPRHSRAATAASDELGEAKLLWRDLAIFMVEVIHDKHLRGALAHAGVRRLDLIIAHSQAPVGQLAALPQDLADNDEALASDSLALAGDTLGEPFVARLITAMLQESRASQRHLLLGGLRQLRAEPSASAARMSLLQPGFKANEVLAVLEGHMQDPVLRRSTWDFVVKNLPRLRSQLGDVASSRLIGMAGMLCDAEQIDQVTQIFEPLVGSLRGSPRALAQAKERIALCVADRQAARPGALAFFQQRKLVEPIEEAEDNF